MSTYQPKDIPGRDNHYRRSMALSCQALLQALQREHPKLIRHLQSLPGAQRPKT